MNANELADLFNSVSPSEKYYDEMQEAAIALRHQQSLIDGADVVIKELQERRASK